MSKSSDNAMRLDLIAAKAKQLAEDVRNGRLWEGQLSEGLSELQQQLSQVRE